MTFIDFPFFFTFRQHSGGPFLKLLMTSSWKKANKKS